MDFLPTSYEVPEKAGPYMKFKSGENRFRILSSPIIGWEWWEDNGDKRKVTRVPMDGSVPSWAADQVKHFWAMPVWNYDAKKVQVLNLTQKGIQKYIKALAKNPKWGSPTQYDLVVTKAGEKLETEYDTVADPKEPLDSEIEATWKKTVCNLQNLFIGKDWFDEVNSDQLANDAADALG